MDLKKTTVLLTILLLFLFAPNAGNCIVQENPLVKAIQLFDEGKFSESEQILKKLLDEKPNHLMVNYYYGACRTENGHYGTNEIIYLLNGSTGEAPLKTEYYLAVQYHAKNRWDEALKHYTRYKGDVNEEMQNEVRLAKKIQQCYDKFNPFVSVAETTAVDVLPAAIPREEEIEEYNPVVMTDSLNQSDSVVVDLIDSTLIEALEELKVESKPKFEPINFVINGEITYLDSSNFQTEKGFKAYTDGTKKHEEYVEHSKELNALREKYGTTKSYDEKKAIGKQILASETNNYKLQSAANQLLLQAKQAEIEYWENASFTEKEAFIAKLDEELAALHTVETVDYELADTASFIDPTAFLVSGAPGIAIEDEKRDEIIYKIQLGAYSRGIPSYRKKQFDKLAYIRKIENYTDEKGVVVYTTGNLTNYDDAIKMQTQVRQEGVQDAFVVPYFNGKRITLKEAKEIEAGQ